MTLLQSHRICGYETARCTDRDGRELVILQTAPHKEEVSLAHLVRPMSQDEVRFKVGVLLTEAIEQARFLGLGDGEIATLFAQELGRDNDTS